MLDHIKALTNTVRFRWNARHLMVPLRGETSWAVCCTIIIDRLHSSPMLQIDFPHHTGGTVAIPTSLNFTDPVR